MIIIVIFLNINTWLRSCFILIVITVTLVTSCCISGVAVCFGLWAALFIWRFNFFPFIFCSVKVKIIMLSECPRWHIFAAVLAKSPLRRSHIHNWWQPVATVTFSPAFNWPAAMPPKTKGIHEVLILPKTSQLERNEWIFPTSIGENARWWQVYGGFEYSRGRCSSCSFYPSLDDLVRLFTLCGNFFYTYHRIKWLVIHQISQVNIGKTPRHRPVVVTSLNSALVEWILPNGCPNWRHKLQRHYIYLYHLINHTKEHLVLHIPLVHCPLAILRLAVPDVPKSHQFLGHQKTRTDVAALSRWIWVPYYRQSPW